MPPGIRLTTGSLSQAPATSRLRDSGLRCPHRLRLQDSNSGEQDLPNTPDYLVRHPGFVCCIANLGYGFGGSWARASARRVWRSYEPGRVVVVDVVVVVGDVVVVVGGVGVEVVVVVVVGLGAVVVVAVGVEVVVVDDVVVVVTRVGAVVPVVTGVGGGA